jgi:hypothetical protein
MAYEVNYVIDAGPDYHNQGLPAFSHLTEYYDDREAAVAKVAEYLAMPETVDAWVMCDGLEVRLWTAQQHVTRFERDPFAPVFTVVGYGGQYGPLFDVVCDGCDWLASGHQSDDEAREAARSGHPSCSNGVANRKENGRHPL